MLKIKILKFFDKIKLPIIPLGNVNKFLPKNMNLFTINHQLHPTTISPLKLKTPLGDVVFNCEIFNDSLLTSKPIKIEEFKSENKIASWVSNYYIIEFMLLNIIPKLPVGMKVDECFFGIWRLKSLIKKINCNFTCKFESNVEGSPESGEGLASEGFENDSYKVNIGTADEDYLQQRAASEDWLPLRFKDTISFDHIDYLHNGIKIILPELLPNENLQMHFVVSWTSKKNEEISTWYAVDQSPIKILEEASIQ